MKIINVLTAYFLYFIAPKKLMHRSLHGTLIQIDARLPIDVSYEIALNLFDIYSKNKEFNKVTRGSSINANMQTMLALIEFEAFYIRDLLSSDVLYLSHDTHTKTIKILKKYGINLPNYRS